MPNKGYVLNKQSYCIYTYYYDDFSVYINIYIYIILYNISGVYCNLHCISMRIHSAQYIYIYIYIYNYVTHCIYIP